MMKRIASDLENIRRLRPLVHNITNYVVMNFTANALLALGASPVMAHAPEEAAEMASLSGALVINIGTLSSHWVEAMFLAARAAEKASIPMVLDPVGAGATRFRTETARRLATEARPAVIRGNGSEILSLTGKAGGARGVDSSASARDAHSAALALAKAHSCTVAVTGIEDFVTDGERIALISNGSPLLGRVTGTGCAASALTGAFCAVERDPFLSATAALVVLGIAGEIAAGSNPGVGTFQTLLLDALDRVDERAIEDSARVVFSLAQDGDEV